MPRLAARYADEFVIGQPTPDEARQVRALLDAACSANGRNPSTVALSVFAPIAVGVTSAEVEQHMQTYRQTNPQYVRMMDNPATWLRGTPSEVRAQLDGFSEAGIARVMVSVNCDLHRQMLPLLAQAL